MISRPRIRQLGLGELLDETFRLYRRHFLVFVAVAAISQVLTAIVSYLGGVSLTQQIATSIDTFQSIGRGVPPTPPTETQAWWFPIFSFVSGFALQPIVTAALVYLAAQAYLDRDTAIDDGLAQGVRRWPMLVGVYLLFLLAMIPFMCILFAVVLAVMFGASLASNGDSFSAILLGIGIGLLIALPLVYLSIRLLFTTQAITVERAGPINAIKRSWLLSGGSFWRIFGYYIIISLLTSVISGILPLVIGILVLTVADSTAQRVIEACATAIVGTLVLPYSLIALTLLYFDLRVRKESFDLQQQSEAMFATGTPYPPRFTP
jgi:hypothetical protein